MKKFLIVLSGIYLILVGILLVALAILSCISRFPLPPQASNIQIEYFHYAPFIILITVLALFALWLMITGAGIILKKTWARLSVFVMSILAIVLGFFISLASLILPLLLQPPNAKVEHCNINIFALGFIFIFFIAIPIFFLIFFKSKSVKELFIKK